jgi:hypothetical protein
MGVAAASGIVDLVPFILVSDIERSNRFYEALGFEVVKRYEPNGRLEFAGLEATSAAKVMLARVDEVPETGPDAATPGFLYLYTKDLEALRAQLLSAGHHAEEILMGPGRGRTARCACAIPTVTATWSPSCSRAPSRATPAGGADADRLGTSCREAAASGELDRHMARSMGRRPPSPASARDPRARSSVSGRACA